MNPLDAAWSLLKALPEQQVHRWSPRTTWPPAEPPRGYSAPWTEREDTERVGTIHPAIAGLLERTSAENFPEGDYRREALERGKREFDIQNTSHDDFPRVPQPLLARHKRQISPLEWVHNPVPVSTELESRVEGQPYFPPHDVPNPDAGWHAQTREHTPLHEQIGHDADLIDPKAGWRGTGAPIPLPQHTYVPPYPSYRSPKFVTSDASLSPQVGPTGMPEGIPSDWAERHPWEDPEPEPDFLSNPAPAPSWW